MKETDLLNLPEDIIKIVLSKLAPKALSELHTVNRYLNKLTSDPILWMKKFERHFSKEYQVLKQKTPAGQAINWFSEFAQTYEQVYKTISKPTKELISLLKEQDLAGLKKKEKSLNSANFIELFEKGYKLLIKQSAQDIRDYCYQLAISQEPNTSQASSSNTPSVLIPEREISILGWAIRCHQKKEVIEQLIAEGQPIDDKFLMTAISMGHSEAVLVLLDHPKLNDNGIWAFWDAVQDGDIEIVKALLARPDINYNTASPFGDTPLFTAALNGDIEIVKALLARPSINCNTVNRDGATALLIAALKGHVEIVKALLARPDINCNTVNRHGATALLIAALNGHIEIVEALLAKPDTNCNATLPNGVTPLLLVTGGGHIEIVKALLAQPDINYNAADRNGITPLCIAAQKGDSAVVDLLLLKKDVELAHPFVSSAEKLKQFALTQVELTQHRMDLFIQTSLAASATPDSIAITPYQIACIMNQETIIASLGAALNFLPTTNESFIALKDYANKKADSSMAFFDGKTSSYTEEQQQAAHDLLFLYACFGSLSESQIPPIAKHGILGELVGKLLTEKQAAQSTIGAASSSS